MKNNKNISIHDLIMEEVNRNPILTEEELAYLTEPESEDDIRKEEALTESIFNRVSLIEDNLGHILSESEFRNIVSEEIIKRK